MHPREQLAPTSIKPKRSFGQNFLADESHLGRITKLCMGIARDANKTVVEMGAGLGALTEALADAGATVIAVERDRDLFPLLQERMAGRSNVTLHEDNALTFPLDALAGGGALVGNLPYHHATQIALRALDVWPNIGGACFLVQLEVGERLAAQPGNKNYGSLSVVLQSRFDVGVPHVVPKGAFWPVPEVDGGVVVMRTREHPRGAPHQIAHLEELVRAGFQQRRKTLRNAVSRVDGALDAIAAAGIDAGARAEDVAVEAWCKAAAALGAARA